MIKEILIEKAQMLRNNKKKFFKSVLYICIFVLLFVTIIDFINTSYRELNTTIVTIEKGDNLPEIAFKLKDKAIIGSSGIFQSVMRISGLGAKIKAGDYEFYENMSLIRLVKRLIRGEFGNEFRLTIPEGLTRFQIADKLKRQSNNFNEANFLELTKDKEGKLFPDTYYFIKNLPEDIVVKRMLDNYEEHTKRLRPAFKKSKYTEEEILVMASIIEREAKGRSDAFLISGILWNRIRKGMKLQVDAPFFYLIGKGSFGLTKKELRDDHEFNTYVNAGLPPTPIANPGLRSIDAALHPQPTSALFYLHDKRGGIHIAKTYSEHMKNRDKYIGNR